MESKNWQKVELLSTIIRDYYANHTQNQKNKSINYFFQKFYKKNGRFTNTILTELTVTKSGQFV